MTTRLDGTAVTSRVLGLALGSRGPDLEVGMGLGTPRAFLTVINS